MIEGASILKDSSSYKIKYNDIYLQALTHESFRKIVDISTETKET